jgi:hypothetical protein
MSRYSKQKDDGPIGDVASCIGRYWIAVHCGGFHCGHHATYDPLDLAGIVGRDLPL